MKRIFLKNAIKNHSLKLPFMPCIEMIGFRGFVYKMKECTEFLFSVCRSDIVLF